MIATTEFPPGMAPARDMKSHSCDELREIVSHGIVGGELFVLASKEIERRAREADETIHAREAATQSQARRIAWLALALVGVVLALAVVRLFGLRV